MKNFIKFYNSIFLIGNIKKFPGTFASGFSILILFPFFYFELFNFFIILTLFVTFFLFSLYSINFYSEITKTHDSKEIVIDEFLGVYFIFLFYEKIYIIDHYITIFLIFILFRFFDITKIYPANIVDRNIKNSLGVILDDIIAAIYTITTMYLLNVFI